MKNDKKKRKTKTIPKCEIRQKSYAEWMHYELVVIEYLVKPKYS